MSSIIFSEEFKKISVCPNYPIRGFNFIAIPSNDVPMTQEGVEDFIKSWKNGISNVKVSSSISEYSNSRLNDGQLTVTLCNKGDSIQYSGSHIGFIYKDLVTDKDQIMAIAFMPNDPNELNWMISSSSDKHEYINYMFEFGDLLSGIKCDLQIKSNDKSVDHIESSDVDKYLFTDRDLDDTKFIIRNSADYILRSKITNLDRDVTVFMINPSGVMNYGQKI